LESPPESSRIFEINWNFGRSFQIELRRLRISSAGRAQPPPPFAQCPRGDRLGVLPRNLQEQAEVFELDDQLVLAGDQLVGAFALALVVRLVPGRARTIAFLYRSKMESRARKSRALNSLRLGTRYTVGTLDNVGAVAYLGGGAHV
jgi:hypothetical protein